MKSKTQQIQEALAAGEQIAALRVAARFFDRSAGTMIFKRGMDAYNNPAFYCQLGQDPDQIIAAALKILVARFDLQAGNRVVAGHGQHRSTP